MRENCVFKVLLKGEQMNWWRLSVRVMSKFPIFSQMRIPTEHFRNVPVVLLSPSLMTTPVTSTAPSPSHHAHLPPNGSAFDEAFPRSLLERLMRTETQSKVDLQWNFHSSAQFHWNWKIAYFRVVRQLLVYRHHRNIHLPLHRVMHQQMQLPIKWHVRWAD